MNKQFKEKQDKLKEEKEKLAKQEKELNELIATWDFYNSNESKKFINFPTFNELLDYEGKAFDEYDNINSDYNNLEYDLTYLRSLLDKAKEYDFFVPCPLLKRKIKPKDLSDIQISETYIYFIETLCERLENARKNKI